MKKKRDGKIRAPRADRQFISPSQLMVRWRCSRSGVDQITAHAGLARRHNSKTGRRNNVNFLLSDVVAYEKSCMKRA
jgi:pyridoxine 5'-phosphate synthase PdxJ